MDIIVSRQTVIACLKSLGFGSYFAAHKPRLTEVNMKKRLRCAMEHVNWTEDQWKSVVWSDESRFSLNGNDTDARVIRKVGEKYQARHIIPTTGGFGPLAVIEESVNRDVYINILAETFHP
ncbi:hypothetical protein G6F56_009833 [Rhizopus delemar]|nr:hypothetical protein G6F56_009833 [Rhizopus delemar]